MSWKQNLHGYVWRLKKIHPERFGQRCAIVRSSPGSLQVVVEFEDGLQVRTGRASVRRVFPEEQRQGPAAGEPPRG